MVIVNNFNPHNYEAKNSRNWFNYLLFFWTAVIFFSCQKESPHDDLPQQVSLKQSEYFVSPGQAADFAQQFILTKGNTQGKGTSILSEIDENFPVINQENDTVFYAP